MSLEDVKFLYLFLCVGLGLVIISPTLALVVQFPEGERFSELWILGPEYMAMDYPVNVETGEDYEVVVGVGNHMGRLTFYRVYVKLRNETEALPNATTGVPSSVLPLYEYGVFLEEDETWEVPFTFSFGNVSFYDNRSRIGSVTLNGQMVDVDKEASWNVRNHGYYYQIFFELWMYHVDFDSFVFHNRFVGLWLNITERS